MKKKNLHLIFAITIGAIIIAATSYCVWKMNKDIDNTIVEIEQNGETSDWKTYTNAEYSFEVKCPSDWEDQSNQSSATEYGNSLVEYKNLFYREKWGKSQKADTEFYDGAYVKVSIVKNNENLNFDEFIKNNVQNSKKILLYNIQAVEVLEKISYGDNIIEQSSINTFYFEYNKNIYRITLFSVGPDYILFGNTLREIQQSLNIY